jgi:hypothetical protein
LPRPLRTLSSASFFAASRLSRSVSVTWTDRRARSGGGGGGGGDLCESSSAHSKGHRQPPRVPKTRANGHHRSPSIRLRSPRNCHETKGPSPTILPPGATFGHFTKTSGAAIISWE